jgi:HD-GYP domain-containing protein (c-di-GMP phosphodiesterase class II)
MLGHSSDVAELAARATDERESIERLRVASFLHDLGTVSVPNGILDKPGPLNASEWERVRLHGYHTERILARTPLLAPFAMIAGSHHERLDGGGYPVGLVDHEIHPWAKLCSVVDVFDALTSDRPYRPAIANDVALNMMDRDDSIGFDSEMLACWKQLISTTDEN